MRKLRIYLGGLLIFGLLYFAIMHLLISTEITRVSKYNSDYAIVLGARLYGETPSPSLVLRLESVLEYLEHSPDTVVILSGGQGKDESISEAEAMRRYLDSRGVSSDRLLLEDKSTNTIENLKFSYDLAKENGSSPDDIFIIISSEYHIYRAKLLAERIGFKAGGFPAAVPPSVRAGSWIREYLALGKSIVLDW